MNLENEVHNLPSLKDAEVGPVLRSLKVAIVHDWFTGMRGGEWVLDAIVELFPQAEIFTLLYIPGTASPLLTVPKKHVSFLQKFPGIERRYRSLLPLMPRAIEKFDLTGFDLIISSSHCVAKGIRKPKGSVHVSYVHAPMRYIWDRYDDYFGKGRASLFVRAGARAFRKYLQNWDRKVSSPENVDAMIANSAFIGTKIEEAYHRKPYKVIHPFVESSRFAKRPRVPGKHYLMVGAFAPYKRVDLAVRAFNELGLPLLIVGTGQDSNRLKKMAKTNVEFLGNLSNASIEDLMARCRAFVFPGKEDFGITPLEAMAAGSPVIAFGEGGALETVIDGKTGVFFYEQTVESLKDAVMKIESGEVQFHEEDARARAAEFSREKFQRIFLETVEEIFTLYKRS